MNTVCACLILIPTIALAVSIDEQIANTSDPRTLSFFHASSDGEIMVNTELDILMTLDEYKQLHQPATNSRRRRQAPRDFTGGRWYNNEVNYRLVGAVAEKSNVIKSAMDHWEKYTCLKFQENPSARFRIDFQYGTGCSSMVGRQKYAQPLYLAKTCATLPVVVHEIGHAIGFEHEHNRPDRNAYISAHCKYVANRYPGNSYTPWTNTYNISYDYTSIMHYRGNDCMRTRDHSYQNKIGNSPGLSFKDIKRANLMYDCSSPHCPRKACPFNGFVLMKSLKGKPKCECWCATGMVEDPLVVCSFITKEYEEPNLLGWSRLAAANVSICIDMLFNCMYLKEQGLCRTEIIVMYTVCPKTCDFCGKGNNLCMDLEDGCGMMAASGACQQGGLREMMSRLCPKSCGLCDAISAPCDIEFSLMDPSNPIDRGVSSRIQWITVLNLIVVASGFWM